MDFYQFHVYKNKPLVCKKKDQKMASPKPENLKLWETVNARVKTWPSAYASGQLVQEQSRWYKEELVDVWCVIGQRRRRVVGNPTLETPCHTADLQSVFPKKRQSLSRR